MFSPAFIRSQYTNLPIPHPSTFTGKTYIVTGANTGLGYECTKHLVSDRASRVILAVRSRARGEAALSRIEEFTGITGIAEVWELDLSDYRSVKRFAERAKSQLDRIDGVIENASVALSEWSVNEADGMEMTLATNVVGTFLLAVLLLPRMMADAERLGTRPHLVIVSSTVGFMFGEGMLDKVEGDVLDYYNKEEQSGGEKLYPISKLLQAYATRELATLLPVSKTGVVINSLNPGICETELDRNAGFIFRMQLKVIRMLMGRTAEMGSRNLLHAVQTGDEVHGKYIEDCRVSDENMPAWVVSAEGQQAQKRVWKSISNHIEAIEPGCIRVVTRCLR